MDPIWGPPFLVWGELDCLKARLCFARCLGPRRCSISFSGLHRSSAIVGLDQDPPTSFITLFGPVQRTQNRSTGAAGLRVQPLFAEQSGSIPTGYLAKGMPGVVCRICRRHRSQRRMLCTWCNERWALPSCRPEHCWIAPLDMCRWCFENEFLRVVLGDDRPGIALRIIEFLNEDLALP